MIAGLGIDIVDVERIAEKIKKENGFRELVFSANEIAYCEGKTHRFEHYAARFAAKEAFFKALGTGWLSGTAFNEIEINNDDTGRPRISLIGGTRETVENIGQFKIHVSLSHTEIMATAIVILETT